MKKHGNKWRCAGYFSGAPDIPTIHTTYDAANHAFVVRMLGTEVPVDKAQLAAAHNEFIQSISVRSVGGDAELVLHLTAAANYYTAKHRVVDDKDYRPYVQFTFSPKNLFGGNGIMGGGN